MSEAAQAVADAVKELHEEAEKKKPKPRKRARARKAPRPKAAAPVEAEPGPAADVASEPKPLPMRHLRAETKHPTLLLQRKEDRYVVFRALSLALATEPFLTGPERGCAERMLERLKARGVEGE